MLKTLLGSAAILAIAAGTPALAQTSPVPGYLRSAQQAVQEHHTLKALSAIDRAEAEMLDNNAPASRATSPDDSPVVHQMARAREAITAHHWRQASDYIKEAMDHASDSSFGGGSNPSGTPAVGQKP